MAYTQVPEILALVQTALQAELTGWSVIIDEPVDLVYSSLPECYIYPTHERFSPEDSFSATDSKSLALRIEIRMHGSPASIVCSPIINRIVPVLRGLDFPGRLDVVPEQIQYASDRVTEGSICGAALDLTLTYMVSL